MEAGKPIAAIGAGVSLLALSAKISGRMVAAPIAMQDEMKAAGAMIGADAIEIEGNLLTSNGEDIKAWVEEALRFFAEATPVMQAA